MGGPWLQVPPIALSDISLMPCLAQSRMEQVPVWALGDKGDVLCRLGVSAENPAVRAENPERLWSTEGNWGHEISISRVNFVNKFCE